MFLLLIYKLLNNQLVFIIFITPDIHIEIMYSATVLSFLILIYNYYALGKYNIARLNHMNMSRNIFFT